MSHPRTPLYPLRFDPRAPAVVTFEGDPAAIGALLDCIGMCPHQFVSTDTGVVADIVALGACVTALSPQEQAALADRIDSAKVIALNLDLLQRIACQNTKPLRPCEVPPVGGAYRSKNPHEATPYIDVEGVIIQAPLMAVLAFMTATPTDKNIRGWVPMN